MALQKVDNLKDMGRRSLDRVAVNLESIVSIKINSSLLDGDYIPETEKIIKCSTTSLHFEGMSFKYSDRFKFSLDQIVTVTITYGGQTIRQQGRIIWHKLSEKSCGVKFKTPSIELNELISNILKKNISSSSGRRTGLRRIKKSKTNIDLRKNDRRYSLLIEELIKKENGNVRLRKKPISRIGTPHSIEAIHNLREWVENETNTKLKHIAHFSESASDFKGKIENPIGVAHIPLGISGPLAINGDFAKGFFFVPLATTEGALVTSYNLGSLIITKSGGANVKILKDELRIGPVFVFKSLNEACVFISWLEINFKKIKEIAESTSGHIELLKCTPIIEGRRVIVNFHYKTGDAMGMNMACYATDAACKMITDIVHPEEFWLRSNYNSNKKVTANNLINGYGKMITADVTIPRKLITLLNTTPEAIQRYAYRTLLADVHAGMIGHNGHFANAIAAIYTACGQDIALVTNAQTGITTCEVNQEGDLYMSVYLSSLLLGTVGGGTAFGTAQECLNLIGCYGTGKADKFAEIIAATVLAGEISIGVSIVNGTYIRAHETLGRNRPNVEELEQTILLNAK